MDPEMDAPEIDALVREQRQLRRVRRDARCETCRDHRHLIATDNERTLCYACLRAEHGARPMELDHPAGRRNLIDFVVPLRPNDHRTVTEWRTCLGIDDWPDAGADPLRLCAHVIAGLATLLLLIAEWLLAIAPEVADRLGATCWDGVRAAPFVQ
jgi:hypothetical protein